MVKTCVSCQGQFETEDPNKTVCPSCEAAQNIGSPEVKVGEASVSSPEEPAAPTTVPETPAAPAPEGNPVAPAATPPPVVTPETPVQPNPTGEVPPQDQTPQG